MPQRRGLRGAAHGAFGAASNIATSMFQNNLIKDRQQQFIDSNDQARAQALEEKNRQENIQMGLPPDTPPEERARFVAAQRSFSQFNQNVETANSIPLGEGGSAQGIVGLRDQLPPGHPLRAALEQRMSGMGIQPFDPSGPTAGETPAQPIRQSGVGSLAAPREQFARDAAIQGETQKTLGGLADPIVAAKANEAGAIADAQLPSIERVGAEADARRAPDKTPDQIREEERARAEGRALGTPPSGGSPSEKQSVAGLVSASAIEPNATAIELEGTINGTFQTFGGPATEAGQRYDQAHRAFANMIRTLTGAAISEEEAYNDAKRFFASTNDRPATIQQKQRDRTQYLINQIVFSGDVANTLGISVDDVILSVGDAGATHALKPAQVERYIRLVEEGR